MSLVFCLGFRDWDLDHLRRCLASLRLGTKDPILVVDYGSREALMPQIRKLCVEHAAHWHTVLPAEAPEWSRSRALNRAMRCYPEATHYVFTDADMLFTPRWFEVVTALGPGLNQTTLWLTRSRDFDEATTEALDRLGPLAESLDWCWANSIGHTDLGQGGGMIVPGPWFRSVGGFDEYYRIWGAEDQDLVDRARWAGLTVDWLPATRVFHQWHRRDWPTPTQFEQVRRNKAYYAARQVERGPIVRNRSPE